MNSNLKIPEVLFLYIEKVILDLLYLKKKHTFSETDAKPFVGCWVLMSKQWNFASSEVATNLFMLISFLSNSSPHT